MYAIRIHTISISMLLVPLFACGNAFSLEAEELSVPRVDPTEPIVYRKNLSTGAVSALDPSLQASAGISIDGSDEVEDRIALWFDSSALPEGYGLDEMWLHWTDSIAQDGLFAAVGYVGRADWDAMSDSERFEALNDSNYFAEVSGRTQYLPTYRSLTERGVFLIVIRSRDGADAQTFGDFNVVAHAYPPPILVSPPNYPNSPTSFPIQLIWLNEANVVQIATDENFENVIWEHLTAVERHYKKKLDVVFDASELPHGRTLYWRARLEQPLRKTGWSDTWSFRTPDPVEPRPLTPYVTSYLPRQRIDTVRPELSSSQFESLNGRTHNATQWQIARDFQFEHKVWGDLITEGDLITHRVPPFALQACRYYAVRVRHQDDAGAWSDWSPPAEFFTSCDLEFSHTAVFGDERYENETRAQVRLFRDPTGIISLTWNDLNWDGPSLTPQAVYMHQTTDGHNWTSAKAVLPKAGFAGTAPGTGGTLGIAWYGSGQIYRDIVGLDIVDSTGTAISSSALDPADGWTIYHYDVEVLSPGPETWLVSWVRRKDTTSQLMLRRSSDDGLTWTAPVSLYEYDSSETDFPIDLVTDYSGDVLLYTDGYVFRSSDYGASWDGPEQDALSPEMGSRNMAAFNGTWIAVPLTEYSAEMPYRSRNAGRTWSPVRIEPVPGLDHPPAVVGWPVFDEQGNWVVVGGSNYYALSDIDYGPDVHAHYLHEYDHDFEADGAPPPGLANGSAYWVSRDDGRTWYGPEWLRFPYPTPMADQSTNPSHPGSTIGQALTPDGLLYKVSDIWTSEGAIVDYDDKRKHMVGTATFSNLTRWLDLKSTEAGEGSVVRPVNTLQAAIDSAPEFGSVQIFNGATSDAVRIEKPLRLEAHEDRVLIGAVDPELNRLESPRLQSTGRIVLPPAQPIDSDEGVENGTWMNSSLLRRTLLSDANQSEDDEAIPGQETIFEPVFPLQRAESTATVDSAEPVAVRLLSATGIVPGTVTGEISGLGRATEPAVRWFPASDRDLRDVWVVFEPASAWPLGTSLQFRALARSADGTRAVSERYAFVVLESGAYETGAGSDLPPKVNSVSQNSSAGLSAEDYGITGIAQIAPTTAFEQPQPVRIPSNSPQQTTLWYYKAGGEQSGWFPASNVLGFCEDEPQTLHEDTGTWLVFSVRHGGIVGMAPAP